MTRKSLVAILLAAGLFPQLNFAGEGALAKQYATAKKLIKKKDYDSAAVLLDNILEKDAVNAPAIYSRAYIHEMKRNIEAAIVGYYRCVEVLVEQEDSEENQELMDKCKKILMRVDKSRRVILKHADMLEREAKKLKSKDALAYDRIMKVVEAMREAVKEQTEEKDDNDEKKLRRALEKRVKGFFLALAHEDYGEATKFIEVQTLNFIGRNKAIEHLKIMGAIMNAAVKRDEDFGVSKVKFDRNKRGALVTTKIRFFGKWKDMDDPGYWIYRRKEWYLGDNKNKK